ncbi:MAG TPA: response regulator [Candidatus Nealsonbacteria bacterium]|uniref:Response regulatory domain-containing protein n=1 Tax=marine sediment metagenome TaxID=412755 RepID=A0A0F9XT36_9ZZZZ|nr:response regulator [Candidatus Nealsonbacteria bacterium]HEB46680.1 response regulator [Candidatus Nealsonbacteria bacterium]
MNKKDKGTILIIEDEAGFRRIYRDVLENDGYEVLEAEDGESGWQLVKSKRPDLVLLDLILPKLHGFEVLKNIRADAAIKDIPVIIFSVLGGQKNIQKGLELGANDYTVKGFYSPREILSKIHALLTKVDITKNINSYKLEVKEGRADAAKLQQDIDFSKGFRCSHCKTKMALELIPDYTRTNGHWFVAHFVCPKCKRAF